MADSAIIRQATTAADLAAVRRLCWAYRDFLHGNSALDRLITETFYPVPKYEKLMQGLGAEHAGPGGVILLAEIAGQAVGCGMTHGLDPQTSEIKRVFVTHAARRQGIAMRVCRALMARARDDGIARVVLDTSTSLTGAAAL